MSDHAQLDICLEKWKQFDKHEKDSVPVRDNVRELMLRVKILEQGVMKNAVIGGLIGALIGSGAAPAISGVLNLLLGG
jgi:hypothetical protein